MNYDLNSFENYSDSAFGHFCLCFLETWRPSWTTLVEKVVYSGW